MKNYKFRINGNQYEVELLEIEGNIAKIEVNGTVYDVEMQRETTKAKSIAAAAPVQVKQAREPKPAPEKTTGKAAEVRAPLPGVIIQLLVRQGDEIKPGQTVCTLETMKMENAIKSENGGVVTAVNISVGQQVLQDEVLIVIG